jgi:nucleotide-binding universal stress UspA family protein
MESTGSAVTRRCPSGHTEEHGPAEEVHEMATRLDVLPGAVVVGFDVSGRSRRAVDWAAGEAERRGAPLQVVSAIEWPVMVEGVPPMTEDDLLAPLHRAVEEELERVRQGRAAVTASGTAVIENPSVVLVEASKRASLVVVGARGRGPFTGALLGSVSQKVAAHAQGPVVVVHGETPAELSGPVVVGIDPTDPSRDALEYAFDEARRRGVGVIVVSAAEHGRTRYSYSPRVSAFFTQQAEEDQEALRRMADEMALEHGVEVEIRRLAGDPVDAILGVAGADSLVVVGSRGHRGLTGLLLGSVSRGVLHRAPVVAVVRVHAKTAAKG